MALGDGVGSLLGAFSGNPARKELLFQQGALGSARLEDALSEARRKRDKEAGYAAITPGSIAAAQADPSRAPDLVSALFHADINPTQLSGYNKEALGTTIQNDIYQQARNGASIANLNPLLAAMEGKVQNVSTVQGDVSFNPTVAPDQNRFDPTQVGFADIMQKGAQAEASRASAASSYASAQRSRAGIGLDKAANYRIEDTGNGLVRIPILGGDAVPVTYADGSQVQKAAGGGRAPNNDQNNAAGYAQRMVVADQTLATLEDKKYDPTNVRDRAAAAGANVGGLYGYVGNRALSDSGQLYNQAAQNWVRANLRRESGAVIGRDEMATEISNYFPQAGDTPDLVAQKTAYRKLIEQNMIRSAGPAWTGSPSQQSSSHSSGPQAGHVEDGYRFRGGDAASPSSWEKI